MDFLPLIEEFRLLARRSFERCEASCFRLKANMYLYLSLVRESSWIGWL